MEMRKVLVLVDSRERDHSGDTTPTEYTITLPQVYKNVVKAELKSLEVPATFYIFSSTNNNATARFTLAGDVVYTADVTLPDGNYSGTTLPKALKHALESAFPGAVFEVTMDYATLKLSITTTAGYELSLDTTVHVDPAKISNWGLGYFLGFNKNTVATGTTLTSPNVVCLMPYTYLALCIDGLNALDEAGSNRTVEACFARVPLGVNTYDILTADARTTTFGTCILDPPIHKLNKLRVKWRFQDHTAVNFNNVEHCMAIELTVLPTLKVL